MVRTQLGPITRAKVFMRIKKFPHFVLLTLLLTQPIAASEEIVVRAVEITAYGMFSEYGRQFDKGYSEQAPGTDTLDYIRFDEFTDQITGSLGISFGIEYVIHSTPRGKPFDVTGIIHYPPAGLVSPQGQIYTRSEEAIEIKIGEKSFYGFGFDEPWEIIPGEWKFEIRRNDVLLAHKTLTVLPQATDKPSEGSE